MDHRVGRISSDGGLALTGGGVTLQVDLCFYSSGSRPQAKRCECVVIGAFRDGCESGGAFEGIWFDLATPTDDLNWCDVESVELLGVVVDDDEENP